MIGITSYGAYIPRLRLDRMAIFQNMGWFAPAIVMVAQGERAMCNWDEDALTMAVAASRDCLVGRDKTNLDGLYLASTTLPFADRQNAGIVATALNMPSRILAADFTASQKAGTNALLAALESVKSGERDNILVSAADRRETKPGYFYEMWFGDGAASLAVGSDEVIAEFKGSHSVSYDFVPHYRGSNKQYDYMWEERWTRDEGYAKIIPEAVTGLMEKIHITGRGDGHGSGTALQQQAQLPDISIATAKLKGSRHRDRNQTGILTGKEVAMEQRMRVGHDRHPRTTVQTQGTELSCEHERIFTERTVRQLVFELASGAVKIVSGLLESGCVERIRETGILTLGFDLVRCRVHSLVTSVV